ncbi:MAG TPA: sugar transferase [Nocardioides sp.]
MARLRSGALGSLRVVRVRPQRPSRAARTTKVVVERGLAVVGLVLLAPLLLGLACAVRRDSPGPALFRQTRVGLHGEPFPMLKLRTMHHDSEAARAALEGAAR